MTFTNIRRSKKKNERKVEGEKERERKKIENREK